MSFESNKITVTFVQPDGSRESYPGVQGDHVMDVAVDNGVNGIIGQCGGWLYRVLAMSGLTHNGKKEQRPLMVMSRSS